MSGEARSGWLPANAARAIYGQILVTSLVGALSEDSDIDAEYILLSVGATMLVFWLAHVYAEAMSRGLEAGRHVSWAEVRGLAVNGVAAGAGDLPNGDRAGARRHRGVLDRDRRRPRDRGRRRGAVRLGPRDRPRLGFSWAAALFGAAISAGFGLVVVGLKGLVH